MHWVGMEDEIYIIIYNAGEHGKINVIEQYEILENETQYNKYTASAMLTLL